MVRTFARWLTLVAAALAATGAPAQAPPATPAPADLPGVDVTNAAPDPANALRAEALTLFGRADDDRTAAWVASGEGPTPAGSSPVRTSSAGSRSGPISRTGCSARTPG